MRSYWGYHCGGTVLFGNGVIREIPRLVKQLKLSRVLVVTDQGLARAGIISSVRGVLANSGLEAVIYDEAIPEPTMESVLKAYRFAGEHDPELIIGLGGGSCIDLAKMVSLLLSYGGHPSDYFGENQVPGPVRPIIGIPTTAGTGSEMSPVAVVTDDKTDLKVGISSNHLRPSIALLDPQLTLKLPPSITACTGMDALSQAIEAYFAKDYRYVEAEGPLIYQGANPMSDLFAERAIQLISSNLRTAVHQGSNLQARENMLLGNLYSALAFTNSGTSLIHALSYPIAEMTKKAHGEIIGLLLPYIMKYNMSADIDRFSNISALLGARQTENPYENAENGVESVFRLVQDLGLPTKLSEIGIKREQISEMVDTSLGIERLIRLNPKTPRAKDVEAILYEAL